MRALWVLGCGFAAVFGQESEDVTPTARSAAIGIARSGSINKPIDMGKFSSLIVGYGPAGHNFLYQATEIDKNKNRRNRKYAVVEKEAYSKSRCGKIDDVPIPHYKNAFTGGTECKFDETCGFEIGHCSVNDNFYLDVVRGIQKTDNDQWYTGLGPARYMKNGDNEPARCLNNELGRAAFCTRFKPTTFSSRGASENNVDPAVPNSTAYTTSVQRKYAYKFPRANWKQAHLDNLLCNVYCKDGCESCGTTLDDYLLRYVLGAPKANGEAGFENIHPFTGEDCTAVNNCPRQTCHHYLTLHEYYANALGYRDKITGVITPNFEGAEHVIDFNVGYLGDGYGAHEPCSYSEWNAIEYTTAGEFCYFTDGMSGMCREMHSKSKQRISQLGGTLTERYSEEAVSISIKGSLISVLTVDNATKKVPTYRVYKVDKNQGELIIGMPPDEARKLAGNVMGALKAMKAPKINHPVEGTPRGGGKFLDQQKAANAVTINAVFRKPFFAFTFEDTTKANFHMSSRFAGKTGYHSRAEFFNNPVFRRTNAYRPVYTDYWMQNDWLAIFRCIDEGNCNTTALKNRITQNLRLMFPDEKKIHNITEDDILELGYKFTQGAWYWQHPGNHNTPTQLADWAAKPAVGTGLNNLNGADICFISSSFYPLRDGWITGAFLQVAQCLKNIARYDNPKADGTSETDYWNRKLYCGLRPNDPTNHLDTDLSIALNNEFPRVVSADSPTGYKFPDGDATYGIYNGVHIKKNGDSYSYTPCRYDPAARECTTAAYSALDHVACSAKSAKSPFP